MIDLKGLKGFSAWNVYNKIAFNLVFINRFNSAPVDKKEILLKIGASDDLQEIRQLSTELAKSSTRVSLSFEEVLLHFKGEDEVNKQVMLMEALTFTDLADDDVFSLLALHCDANGIPYSPANVSNIETAELLPLMLKSLIACSDLYFNFGIISKADIEIAVKNRANISDEVGDILANNSDLTVVDLIAFIASKGL